MLVHSGPSITYKELVRNKDNSCSIWYSTDATIYHSPLSSQLGPSEYFCQQHTHSIYAEEAIFIVSVIEHLLNFGALQECGVGHQQTTQIAISTLVLGNRDQEFIPVLNQVNNLLAGMEHSL